MNKTMLIIGAVVFVLVGVGLYVANQNSQKYGREKATMMQKDVAMESKDKGSMKADIMIDDKVATGKYSEYSKSAFDESASNRRVLFFYANWCPTCRPADEDLNVNKSKIPSDVTVVRVNYNDTDTDQEEKDLAKKYGVTYQHTFVQIDEQGNQITKWNGGKIEELVINIK